MKKTYSDKVADGNMMYGPTRHEQSHRTMSSFSLKAWEERIIKLGTRNRFEFNNPFNRLKV